jgi:Rrf2 family protein
MIYSNAAVHAIRALAFLAAMPPQQRVLVRQLCEGSNLPRAFVAKIFQLLARDGLLISHKGRGGGFTLARDPSEVSLLQIVRAIDGLDTFGSCLFQLGPCNGHRPCPMREGWEPVRNAILKYLSDTTLAHIVASPDFHRVAPLTADAPSPSSPPHSAEASPEFPSPESASMPDRPAFSLPQMIGT